MPLFPRDAYWMLTRLFDREAPITAIDLGANVGATCRRIVQEFPNATVHAFEPVPDVFETLREMTAPLPGVRPVRLAAGDRAGAIDFHVTRNRWCSSALRPSSAGRELYGDWYDVVRTDTVPMVRLDDWAEENGVAGAEILKIDVQGLELSVLRGAERLLRSGAITSVVCEAQLVQEYENASTFCEIELLLRSYGFVLHQIHEVAVRGPEQQSTCLDGLWLTADALAELKTKPNIAPPELLAAERLRKALAALAERGVRTVAMYGAGKHTRDLALSLDNTAPRVVAIIDDDPTRHGSELAGRPIVSQAEAIARGIGAAVLSSDTVEDLLWERSRTLRDAGVPVVRLYGPTALKGETPVRADAALLAGAGAA